jgi:hypothetical protein
MALSSLDLGLSPWEIVAFLTSGLALSSFALSGTIFFFFFFFEIKMGSRNPTYVHKDIMYHLFDDTT